MMKKLCALVLVLVLVLSLVPAAFSASGVQGQTGTVDVTYTITSATGVNAVFKINYSATALEFDSATGATTNPTEGSGSYTFNTDPNPINTKNGTIKFKVLKDAPVGTYSFTVQKISCVDKDGGNAEFDVTVESVTISACPHTSNTPVTTPATCTEDGKIEYICDQCDAVLQTEVIPHDPNGAHDLTILAAVEPDCLNEGKTRGEKCTKCTYELKQEPAAALGHNFVGGVCTRCGISDPAQGFLYTLDGSRVTITGYTGGKTQVNVPSTLNGAKVTGIAADAFKSEMTDVYLTKNITSIGDHAFPTGTKVHCYDPSYAKTWATDHGYTVVIIGAAVQIDVDTDIYMDVGTSVASPFIIAPEGDYADAKYVSDHPEIVSVGEKSGKLTAEAEGDAKITLTIGSATNFTNVHVRVAPDSFKLNQTEVYLVVADTVTLSVIDVEPAGATTDISWKSSDDAYAEVTAGGVVTAKTVGTAIITATDSNGVYATCKIYINEAVTEISFEQAEYSAEVDLPFKADATVKAGDKTMMNELVTFSSGDPSIADVDPDTGDVTCKATGTVTITATAGTVTASYKLNIIAHVHTPVVTIEAKVPTCTAEGCTEEKHCKTCGALIGTASVPVPATGHVTPLPAVKEEVVPATCSATGSHVDVVYCTCGYEISRSAKITDPKLTHHMVNIPATPATCKEDGNTEGNYCDVCFYVQDESKVLPKIVPTSESEHTGPINTVAAVAADYDHPGYTEGKQCACCGAYTEGHELIPQLKYEEPKKVTLSPADSQTLMVSDVVSFTATVTPSNADPKVTWSSSNPLVAIVDENGKVTAISKGVATIKATSAKASVVGTVEVTVTDSVTLAYIHFDDGDEVIKHAGDDDFELKYTVEPATATNEVTLISQTPGIVTVGEDGKIKVVGSGYGVIKARSDNGKETTIKVTVHTVTITQQEVAPTCLEKGKTKGRKCTHADCTFEVASTTVPALGHKGNPIPAVDATCLKPGMSAGIQCSVCKRVLIEPKENAPALGHNIITEPAEAPTCLKAGKSEWKHCDRCDYVEVSPTVLNPTGHTPDPAVTENHTESTCKEAGGEDTVIYCHNCHEELSRMHTNFELKPHTPVTIPGKTATETEAGLTDGEICKECNTILKEQEYIPPKGSRVPGDVNGDGTVTLADAIRLMQYLADWGVEINESNSDVDGNGSVTLADAIRLMQYLAEWPVTLK